MSEKLKNGLELTTSLQLTIELMDQYPVKRKIKQTAKAFLKEVEMAVSENRLEQGISFFKENNILIDSKNTGEFLRWIVNDVLKEEKDTLEASGLDEKKVKNAIVTKARMWFLNHA